MVPGTNAAFYFENDAAAAGLSLQHGLIVLWAATIVAFADVFCLSPVYVPRTKRPTQAE